MVKNSDSKWVAPLPFREGVKSLPDSRDEARKRLKSTCKTLERKPVMKQHYVEFMAKILKNGHAEPVSLKDLASTKPCWYLPHFGAYHPQKPGKICVVFDSASEVSRISLSKLLLSGPDLTNSLLGVLLRFRRGSTAIPSGFYSVHGRHRTDVSFVSGKGRTQRLPALSMVRR